MIKMKHICLIRDNEKIDSDYLFQCPKCKTVKEVSYNPTSDAIVVCHCNDDDEILNRKPDGISAGKV